MIDMVLEVLNPGRMRRRAANGDVARARRELEDLQELKEQTIIRCKPKRPNGDGREDPTVPGAAEG